MNTKYQGVSEENKAIFENIVLGKKKLLKKAYLIKTAIFIIGSVAIILAMLFGSPSEIYQTGGVFVDGVAIAMLMIAMLLMSNEILLTSNSKMRFHDSYKGLLVESIIKKSGGSLVYEPKGRIHNEAILKSGLFGRKISRYYGSNLISGKLGEHEIQMSEIKLMRGLGCIIDGFLVTINHIEKDKTDRKGIEKLNGMWSTKEGNLYIAFSGINNLFEVSIEKSDRSIEEIKLQAGFLLTVFDIIHKSVAGAPGS